MEESPFLLPVQRIVGSVQVQDDFLRRFLVGFQEDLHQQAVHGSVIQHDLFVALPPTGRLSGQFQSIQGTFSRQCFLTGIRFLHQYRQQWILPQLLVIVQIFVS